MDEVEEAAGSVDEVAKVAGAEVVTEAATVETMVDAVEKAVPEDLVAVTTVVLRVAMVRPSMHHTQSRCRGLVRYTIATVRIFQPPGLHW